MSEPGHPTHSSSDGLWRWLVGGLVGGCVILGLLIAAYAVGYNRGQDHAGVNAVAPTRPTTTPTTTTGTTTTSSPSIGTVTVTAALVSRGKSLYESDGCSACHSLSGSAGVGPSFKI